MIIEEDFVSDCGRRRRRSIRVDLDEVRRGLELPGAEHLHVWRQIRGQLQRRVGEDMFAIWLEPVELIAVDRDERLVAAAPAPTAEWTSKRFSRPGASRRRDEPRGRTGRERFLTETLEPLIGEYADIIIDTPPNLGLLTVNALVVAELVIAPVSAEDDASLHGIRELRRTLRKLADRLSAPSAAPMPILTRWHPLRISSRLIDQALVVESLRPIVRVPARSALFAGAAAARVPLAVSAPDSAPILAYEFLAERITEAIAR